MTEIRQSFHKRPKLKKDKKKTKKLGFEFGAIIENKPENYGKTGDWRSQYPLVSDKCIGCGTCVEYCPEGAIEIKEVKGKKRAVIDYTYCKGCGICAETCPVKAIVIKNQ